MQLSAVLNQMGVLVFIMAIGFVCAKLRVTGPEFNRAATGVIMNVLLSFTILHAAMRAELNLEPADILWALLLFCLALALCVLLGLAAARLLRLGPARRGIGAFAVVFSNIAFVAFPVIQALYGAEGLIVASICNVPYNLLVYTLGVGLISGDGARLKLKDAISAPFVASLLGLALFFSGLYVPDAVVNAFGAVGAATVPMSMLVVGTSLGGVPLRRALGDWRVYILALFRLVVCPAAVWLLLRWIPATPMIRGIVVVSYAAPSAMLGTIFSIQYGRDEAFASECVFVSTVLSAITMPLAVALLL